MGNSPQFSLPPLVALSFVPFLYLQAVLLHPAIPSRWSRPLRLLLLFPAAYLAFVSPFKWRVQPLEWSVGANFRWGIFGPNFVLKALEWGFAKDRSAYTWLGFDEARVVQPSEADSSSPGTPTLSPQPNGKTPSSSQLTTALNGTSSTLRTRATLSNPPPSPLPPSGTIAEPDVGESGRPARVKRRHRRFAADSATPLSIALDALHLLTAMRGIGYAFGPPPKSLAPSPPKARGEFFRRAAARFVRSHIIATIGVWVIIERHRLVPQFLQAYLLPFVTVVQVQPLANVLAYLAVGVSLHAQMLVGFEGAAIVFLAIDYLPLPEAIKPTFDSREWPDLFHRPFEPETVTIFWSQHWHALFRKPFTSVGYEPVSRVVGMLAGRRVGRAAGAVMVFAMSSWMHDQALYSARYGLPSSILPISTLSFTQRYGGWIFFLSQALAVILESLYPLLSPSHARFPRQGLFARIWSYTWVIGLGCVAGRSWIALGLSDGLPASEEWGWQRWVLPTTALAPPPLFTV